VTRFRVLLAGGDRTHQEQYARQFRADPRCVLVGVTDLPAAPPARVAANAALAARFGLPLLPFDEALRLPCDIVSVCVSMPDRAPLIRAFAERGRHLYLDKPLAPSLEEARDIAAACAGAGVRSQIFSQATSAWALAARDNLRSGRLDRLRSVHARMLVAKGPLDGLPSRLRRERPGIAPIPSGQVKREMFDLGYYPVALLTWLIARPVRRVAALTANHFFAQHAAADVEDYGTLLLEFEGGLRASIVCGRIGWRSHPAKGYIDLTLSGSGGIARFAPEAEQVRLYTGGEAFDPAPANGDPMGMWDTTLGHIHWPKSRPIPLFPEPAEADIAAFLDRLDSGAEPEVTAADGVHHIEILEAAYRSAASGGFEVP